MGIETRGHMYYIAAGQGDMLFNYSTTKSESDIEKIMSSSHTKRFYFPFEKKVKNVILHNALMFYELKLWLS
jgi:hypothetical protein